MPHLCPIFSGSRQGEATMAKRISEQDRSEWEKEGGRIRVDSRGRGVYFIRRQVNGRRYEVSTRATTLKAALEHLKRFQADPEGYRPEGEVRAEPIYLDNDLCKVFLAWSMAEGNSTPWVNKQKVVLAWWMGKLRGVDLRRASLRDHILPPLEGTASRAHKIRVLKTFYAWMRKVTHAIATAEDPTWGQLSAPQSRPEQWTRSKVVPRDHVLLAIEGLTSPWREALTVQAGTGLHTTEIIRFTAEGGAIEALPRGATQDGVAGVLVVTQHKSGEPIRVRVSGPVLEAAKRLREHVARMADERAANAEATHAARAKARGEKPTKDYTRPATFSREWYDRAVRAACAVVKHPDGSTGIPVFTPGMLRHSVASWAINAGADPAVVSAYLGHKSPRTTRKFYATFASPTKVPTLM